MISQLQVLNKILNTKDFSIVTLNNLTVDYFYNYKNEFNFIKNHTEVNKVVPDSLTFLAAFPEFETQEVNEPDSYLLEQLFKDYNTAYLATRFNNIKKMLEADKTDEAVEYFRKSVDYLRTGGATTCVDLIKDTSRYQHYLDMQSRMEDYFLKTGFPELDKAIYGIDTKNENMVIAARTGVGKCLAKGTKVLMADGTLKKVEDVRVGDVVQSYNRTNTVLGLHNGISNGYKIIPTKGDQFTVSSNHILTLYKYNEVYDKDKGYMTTNGTGEVVDIMIEDFLALSNHQKHLYKLMRPAVEYSEKTQSIPAYILGLWLGDGTSKYAQVCTADKEIEEALYNYAKESGQECHLLESQSTTTCKIFSIVGKLQTLLRENNLLNNKHIPLNYLTGSRTQRLELLAGLIDTDGCNTNGMFDFCIKSRQLMDDVKQLCRGLGFKVCEQKPKVLKAFTSDKYSNYYRITISGDLSQVPTRLVRKQVDKKNRIVSTNVGFSIEPVDVVEYYGFMCNGDHRYLLADNTLTHNTWTLLTMAAAASMQGKAVGIYSGEMSVDKVGYRLDTLLSGISNKAITHGNPEATREYKKYIDSLPERGLGPIKVLTPAMISGPATVDALRAFIEKEHIEIMFIDQYSLLDDASKTQVMHEKVANISKAIKRLQVEKQIPIISVAQMNRTKNEDKDGNKTQDTTQIGLSDRIGQDATCIIMLDRNQVKDKLDPRKPPQDQLILNIVKNRDGGSGKLTYAADFNNGNFIFIPENTSDQEAQNQRNEYEGDPVL